MGEPMNQKDVEAIREEFPILREKVRGKPLVYLDNAATTQKPRQVLEAMQRYYLRDNSNVHRGVHTLSERASKGYEDARAKVARYLNATESEVIFVRGATEGINLIANTFGARFVGSGDEIIVSELEHHSNIVPWQLLCDRVGARLRVIPVRENGDLAFEIYESHFSSRTKLVALTMVSNAIGTVNHVGSFVQVARDHGVPVLLDAAQCAPHFPLDVRALDCDFLTFSGHKIYGPTGIGVLYGKKSVLESLPPFMGGGDMIRSVSFQKTEYGELPYRFEAGTPNIAGAVGLAAALEYVERIGMDRIAAHETLLVSKLVEVLTVVPGVRLVGNPKVRAGVVSFLVGNIHPHDLGTLLDQEGVAIRAGHHCAQPLMQRFRVPGTARASVAIYNTVEEVEALGAAVRSAAEVFR